MFAGSGRWNWYVVDLIVSVEAASPPLRAVDLVGKVSISERVRCAAQLTALFPQESGDTMRAAGLHAIATVLETEAVLIKSSTAKHADLDPLIDMITRRIAGVIASSKYVLCQYNIPRSKLEECSSVTPGRRAPTISPLEESEWVAVSAMVERKNVANVMDQLVSKGAEDVLILKLDNCRV